MFLPILCVCDSYYADTSLSLSLGLKHVERYENSPEVCFLLQSFKQYNKELLAFRMKSTLRIEGREIQ